jgi:hypothetical protein
MAKSNGAIVAPVEECSGSTGTPGAFQSVSLIYPRFPCRFFSFYIHH